MQLREIAHNTESVRYKAIPKDWKIVKLGDVASVKGRIGWKGLKREEYTEDGPLMLSVWSLIDYNTYGIDFSVGINRLTRFRYEESPEIKLKNGDILVAKDGDIGRVEYVKTLPEAATVNSHVVVVRVFDNSIRSDFLYWLLKSDDFQSYCKAHTSGTTVPLLSQKSLKLAAIPSPAIEEQRRIATILFNVTEAIYKNNQIIEQTQRLKKGLMQELLTKGIGHTKFKRTDLGEIPEEWQQITIDKIIKNKDDVKTGPFGSSLKKEIFVSSGYKIYGQENVIPDDFSIGNYYISEQTFSKMKKYEIKPGDILISLVGTHGKVSIVPDNIEKGIINPRLLKITVDKSKALPEFMKIILSSRFTERQVLKLSHGLTMGIINTEVVRRILFALPPIQEQQKITSILYHIDNTIQKQYNYRSDLESLKKGLMQNLLTGKIRVKV